MMTWGQLQIGESDVEHTRKAKERQQNRFMDHDQPIASAVSSLAGSEGVSSSAISLHHVLEPPDHLVLVFGAVVGCCVHSPGAMSKA